MAFVCSTDLPFLHPALRPRVLRALRRRDALDVVLPVARGYPQPLAAAYRTRLAPAVAASWSRPTGCGRRSCSRSASVLRLDDDALLADPALRAADPTLDSVVNVNEPADYAAARARPAPQVTVECFGVLATRSGRGPRSRPRRPPSAGGRARSTWSSTGTCSPRVNGDQTGRDGELPLIAGDTVAFLVARTPAA